MFREADGMLRQETRQPEPPADGPAKNGESVTEESVLPGTEEERFVASFHVHGEGFQVPISPHAVMSEREIEELLGHIDRTGGTHRVASRKEPPYPGLGRGYAIHISNQDRQIVSDKGFAGWVNTIVENGTAEDSHPPILRYKEPIYLGCL